MSNRKVKIIIIAILCSVVSILSIGYAVLSAKLKISGTATVPGAKCDATFVKEEQHIEKTGSAICDFGEISKTSITGLKATFIKPGDSCTFTIPAKNDGNMINYLAEVVGKNSSLIFEGSGESLTTDEQLLQQYVTYEVRYDNVEINDSTDFSKISPLNAGEQKDVTLKIEFSYDATAVPKNAVTIRGLDRTFVYNCGRLNSAEEFSPLCEDGTLLTPTPISTPNKPVLNGDMIPVYYEKTNDTTGVWKKADEDNANNSWYDYGKQKWANAVTVIETQRSLKDAEVGTEIPMNAINTMWVWIPRYSYTIKSEDGENYYGKRSSCEETPSQELPGEIDVKFVDKDTTDTDSAQYTGDVATNWRTNEAFNFDGKSHDGIWVGKFETTGTLLQDIQACKDTDCNVSEVTIKPGEISLKNQIVSSFFFMARSMQVSHSTTFGFNSTEGDVHMMKNDEWGAVAYLSQSKYGKYGNSDYIVENKEVYINNDPSYTTGKSGGSPSASSSSISYDYNNMTDLGVGKGKAGPGASTTGNITGVYDMSGGAFEYVMAFLNNEGRPFSNSSGFNPFPDTKYFNLYVNANPNSSDWTAAKPEQACNGKICYGHALSETAQWYGDAAGFVNLNSSCVERGGYSKRSSTSYTGIYDSSMNSGYSTDNSSCRITITP